MDAQDECGVAEASCKTKPISGPDESQVPWNEEVSNDSPQDGPSEIDPIVWGQSAAIPEPCGLEADTRMS